MDLTGFKKKNEKNNVFLKEMPHCIAQAVESTQRGRMKKEKHLLSQVAQPAQTLPPHPRERGMPGAQNRRPGAFRHRRSRPDKGNQVGFSSLGENCYEERKGEFRSGVFKSKWVKPWKQRQKPFFLQGNVI